MMIHKRTTSAANQIQIETSTAPITAAVTAANWSSLRARWPAME
jgi:hypothetical protein